MIAVVPRHVHGAFGSGKKKSLAFRIFANRVDGLIVRQSASDLLPRLAAIVRAIDIRTQVVETESIHRCICSRSVEMRSVNLRELAPWSQFGRRHVLPVLSAIACHLNHAIVGSSPNQFGIFRRRSNRIDHTAMLALRRIVLNKRPKCCGNAGIFAREIGADDLPTAAAVTSREQDIRSQIKQMRISWGEN